MKKPSSRLHELIPDIYRSRDSELVRALVPVGGPTDARPMALLLDVLGVPLDDLERSIRALLDDHFADRASAEALPLLAELFAATLLGTDQRTNRVVVARSIRWRRRAGVLATLEELLSLTTGWSAELDEAFRSLDQTQDVRDLLPWRGRSVHVWDPIALADPLTRRVPPADTRTGERPAWSDYVSRRDDEQVDDTLRRLGRADAGRYAISPRTFDLNGWSRPDLAVIRTSRMTAVEIEQVDALRFEPRSGGAPVDAGRVRLHLDPLGRDVPLVWREPITAPHFVPTQTPDHEPDPEPLPGQRTATTLLTPTALAADGDRVEASGAITVCIDGVRAVGAAPVEPPRAELGSASVGRSPALRFADASRPGPGDRWDLELLAVFEGDEPSRATSRQDRPNLLLATEASHGRASSLFVGSAALSPPPGSTVAVRVRRLAGRGAVREAGGTWTPLRVAAPNRKPLSNTATAVDGSGVEHAYRVVLSPNDELVLQVWSHPVAVPAPHDRNERRWIDMNGGAPLPMGSRPRPQVEAGLALIGMKERLVLVGPVSSEDERLGVWVWPLPQHAGSGPAAFQRVDRRSDGADAPSARRDPSLAVRRAGASWDLYLYGGQQDGATRDDLWSFRLTPGLAVRGWKRLPVRDRQERVGATLLARPGGKELLLLGGQREPGRLATSVLRVDLAATWPSWDELESLPIERERAGRLMARMAGSNRVEAIVWDDRTAPRRMVLRLDRRHWRVHRRDAGAPNPPAAGQAVWADGALHVLGAPPLPPSEVVLSVGGGRLLAFLPENPGVWPEADSTFHVFADGSTWRLFEAGQDPADLERPGPSLVGPTWERNAPAQRLGAVRRLDWRPLRLRQRSLGPWDRPLALDTTDLVCLDPRLGRVLLDADLVSGPVRVSYLVGRGSAIGAGVMPADRALPEPWIGPELGVVPTPPDLDEPPDRRDPNRQVRPVTAWLDPREVSPERRRFGRTTPFFASPRDALMQSPADEPVFGVLGSARFAPSRLVTGLGGGLALVATDFGSVPGFDRDDDGLSLSLQPGFAGDRLCDVWLAGLWLTGRLDVALAEGDLDLRWCTIGTPGERALHVAGGGHQRALSRRSVPEPELRIRLFGCQLGSIEVPPWAQVVAAGCTFDAGADDLPAIEAGGSVVLRHCTVRGQTRVAELRASNAVLRGEVRVDRPDEGWIRHSLVHPGGRPPVRHRCLERRASFHSDHPTDPTYLVLADNNGDIALHIGELGRRPGAHASRGASMRELTFRTEEHLPVGLAPYHIDRTATDLRRMKGSRP